MKNCQYILITLLLSLAAMAQAAPGDEGLRLADPDVLEALRATDTPGLPRNLTPGERAQLRLPDLSRVPRTPPIAEHLHTASEYERNEAILMRWGNFNSVLTAMIVPITTGDSLARVLLVVASGAQQASAASTLASAGANLDFVDFVIAPSNAVWIRDYGPRFSSADNERIIVDHEYNRPRPLDNQIPAAIASYLGEDLYDMPINHGGGNFHLFANGEAYMTDLIVDENPGYSAQDVIDLYADYQGVDLTLLPALPASFDSTQHLDMWFLPVDDHTVIIGEYSQNTGGGVPYQVTEDTATLMASRGYTVLRTPGWRTTAHFTYTNSVIVNDLVLMCEFNGYPTQNAQAVAVYEQAFPDKAIIPVNCSPIIGAAGALHCIVKHQPAPTFRLATDQYAATACAPENGSDQVAIEVTMQGINGFDDGVTLFSSGEPAGVSSQFNPGSVGLGNESIWTLTIDANASPGTTRLELLGDDSVGAGRPTSLLLTLEEPLSGSGPSLVSPADQAEGVELQPELEWSGLAGANEYRVQVATDPEFEQIVTDTWVDDTEIDLDEALDSGQMHYWRVLTGNACGEGAWSEAREFRTRFNPVAEIAPDNLLFEVMQNAFDSATLVIGNVGDGELQWTVDTESCTGDTIAPWLAVETGSGSTDAGQWSEVVLTVDPSGMAPGLFDGALCVITNEVAGAPTTVPVTLEVLELPPGEVSVTPGVLSFGSVATGQSASQSLVISNAADAGHAALAVGQASILIGQSVFSIVGNDCDGQLAPQASCQIEVQFQPAQVANHSGMLRIPVDGQTINLNLQGAGAKPEADIFDDRFQVDR